MQNILEEGQGSGLGLLNLKLRKMRFRHVKLSNSSFKMLRVNIPLTAEPDVDTRCSLLLT